MHKIGRSTEVCARALPKQKTVESTSLKIELAGKFYPLQNYGRDLRTGFSNTALLTIRVPPSTAATSMTRYASIILRRIRSYWRRFAAVHPHPFVLIVCG